MENIFAKGVVLLLCAMACASAAPLPSPPPCQPDRNVTPVTLEEYRLMEDDFRGIVGDTKALLIRAQAHFSDSVSLNLCTHTHTQTQAHASMYKNLHR